MKIYSKSGDKGITSLINGKRIPKSHIRIEAYGTIDELISYCGLLNDLYNNNYYRPLLSTIQDKLMTIASILANDSEIQDPSFPQLNEEDISRLEKEIDLIDSKLTPLTSFIIPGGDPLISFCHITRTICRRAERKVSSLSEESEINPLILIYLNRLSDFLFVLARLISNDLNIKEIRWHPKL